MSSRQRSLPTNYPTGRFLRRRVSLSVVGAIAAASILSGCPWRSYEQILTVHVEVLSSMTTKLLETAAAGGRPAPGDVAELLYPLRRARQFAYQYRTYSDRSSYKELEGSLDAYEKLVEEVDSARADDHRWKALRDTVETRAKAVLDQLSKTRAAVERET